jgi:hypothetical protein
MTTPDQSKQDISFTHLCNSLTQICAFYGHGLNSLYPRSSHSGLFAPFVETPNRSFELVGVICPKINHICCKSYYNVKTIALFLFVIHEALSLLELFVRK